MCEEHSQDEYLSTVGSLDAVKVISRFGLQPIVLVAVEIEGREKRTGKLPEKGAWVRTLWERVLADQPNAEGCRLMWSRVFFAFPAQDVEALKGKFGRLLQELFDPALESFCVLTEATGSLDHKVRVLDELEHEISSKIAFGLNPGFHHRLRDGQPWYPRQ